MKSHLWSADESFLDDDGLDDDALARRITLCVLARTGRQIRNLRVDVDGEEVRLTGNCSTFYCKQLAQQAAMDIIHGLALSNDLQVHGNR
ncbi:MAG: hypothetical protein JSS27_08425 [Planctomycetes bacterium]|nr:hypothetical protein [Planctomycetota bacterium]